MHQNVIELLGHDIAYYDNKSSNQAIQIIPDSGHCPQLENFDKFNSILLSYINEI